MQRGRYTKLALRAAMVVTLVVAGIAALFTVEHRRSQAELGAVISDLIRDRASRSAGVFSPGTDLRLVIVREAGQPGLWLGDEPAFKTRWRELFHQRGQFPQASLVTRSSFIVNNLVPTKIRPQLDLRNLPKDVEFLIVTRSDLERMRGSEIYERFPGNKQQPKNNSNYYDEAYFVSQAGFNFSKTEAIVYINFVGGGGGGGNYLLMRKLDGVWHVVEDHTTWMV